MGLLMDFGRNWIAGRYGRAWASEVLAKLGVKRLPPEGMPVRLLDGVRVYVKPRNYVSVSRLSAGLRVMAICGTCERHIPVGRLGQHRCKGDDPQAGRVAVLARRGGWGVVVWEKDRVCMSRRLEGGQVEFCEILPSGAIVNRRQGVR